MVRCKYVDRKRRIVTGIIEGRWNSVQEIAEREGTSVGYIRRILIDAADDVKLKVRAGEGSHLRGSSPSIERLREAYANRANT